MSNITTVSRPHRCTESELTKLYHEIEQIRTLADIDTFEQTEFADCDFHQRTGDWMRDADEKLTADEMIEHINEGKTIVKEWKEWVRDVRCEKIDEAVNKIARHLKGLKED